MPAIESSEKSGATVGAASTTPEFHDDHREDSYHTFRNKIPAWGEERDSEVLCSFYPRTGCIYPGASNRSGTKKCSGTASSSDCRVVRNGPVGSWHTVRCRRIVHHVVSLQRG